MATPGQAVPGTVVSPGAIASPGGAQGITGTVGPTGNPGAQGPQGNPGSPAATTTVGSFTVPNVGATTTVTVGDASWISLGQMVYVANAGGSSLAGALQVTAKAGNQLTLLNPAVVSAIPPADNTQAGLLNQLSGNALDFVGGDNACHSFGLVRLRSYNALGNPNFEVDQRAVNGSLTYAAGNVGQFQADRWLITKNAATAAINGATANVVAPNATTIPGTNFNITRSFLQVNVTTTQATLAAGEFLVIYQLVEGSSWRELCNDVTSLSILCSANIPSYPFNFSLFIRDNASAYSLVIPCSITSANPFNLFTFPNLPIWPSGGTFSQYPGALGYSVGICLGCGTTYQTSTTGSWVSGNLFGTAANTNFMANSGATFQVRFMQHEPGPLCTMLIDKPFSANLDECLRYYYKSYPYGAVPGTTSSSNLIFIGMGANTGPIGSFPYKKIMAKAPTVTGYAQDGTVNTVRDVSSSVNRAITSNIFVGDTSFSGFNITGTPTTQWNCQFHYTADTGW
jgi:hypothetical protein